MAQSTAGPGDALAKLTAGLSPEDAQKLENSVNGVVDELLAATANYDESTLLEEFESLPLSQKTSKVLAQAVSEVAPVHSIIDKLLARHQIDRLGKFNITINSP